MMMVCERHPDIDIKEKIGLYEFALIPRSLFAPDGSMLHCSSKSALMTISEKLPSRSPDQRGSDSTTTRTIEPHLKVIIIDGMAELQCLDKPDWVKNCAQLAEHFVATIEQKYGWRDEVRLIFDRYDVTMSLKKATRENYKKVRTLSTIGSQIPPKSQVPIKKLLAHNKTKMELTT